MVAARRWVDTVIALARDNENWQLIQVLNTSLISGL
jgi:hypothetical protein